MSKKMILVQLLAILLVFTAGCAKQTTESGETDTQATIQTTTPEGGKMDLTGKEVLMVIAPKNFRDEELFDTKEVLESKGIRVIIASKGVSEAKGVLGKNANVDMDIADVKASDYNAVVFVGGPGANVYFDDETALSIAKDSYEQGKVIGAICIAPSILANAGILDGKKATSFSSEKANLESNGAIYTGNSVTVDGNIITADGPRAAKEFGEEIANALR